MDGIRTKALAASMAAATAVVLAVILALHPRGRAARKDYVYMVYRSRTELRYYGAKDRLVDGIDAYIKATAPESMVNGLALLDMSDKYSIDLRFMLAQARLESNFGTAGMARKTHSIFNVYAYDGASFDKISKDGRYAHPDKSIEPYCRLLRDHYLRDGTTEYDLLDRFINDEGKRYASSDCYERDLRNIFAAMESAEISALYDEYLKYKTILLIR